MTSDQAQRSALASLARPARSRRGSPTTGDGDRCPSSPKHGLMLVLSGDTQWCPAQAHDGLNGEPRTRSFWPVKPVTRAQEA